MSNHKNKDTFWDEPILDYLKRWSVSDALLLIVWLALLPTLTVTFLLVWYLWDTFTQWRKERKLKKEEL